MNNVLDVGGGAGDAFQSAAGAWKGAVGCLRHGNAFVARLLGEVHETQGIVGDDDTVGIECHQVVGRRDVDIRRFPRGRLQVQAARVAPLAQALTQQPNVAVEVHGLVRLVGEVRVALAFEAGDLDREQRCQAVELPVNAT